MLQIASVACIVGLEKIWIDITLKQTSKNESHWTLIGYLRVKGISVSIYTLTSHTLTKPPERKCRKEKQKPEQKRVKPFSNI